MNDEGRLDKEIERVMLSFQSMKESGKSNFTEWTSFNLHKISIYDYAMNRFTFCRLLRRFARVNAESRSVLNSLSWY